MDQVMAGPFGFAVGDPGRRVVAPCPLGALLCRVGIPHSMSVHDPCLVHSSLESSTAIENKVFCIAVAL